MEKREVEGFNMGGQEAVENTKGVGPLLSKDKTWSFVTDSFV